MNPIIFRPGANPDVDVKDLHVIAVDIGFAQTGNKSCGVASTSSNKKNTTFGDCINEVAAFIKEHHKIALIVEAPLSGLFDDNGNPIRRGVFEAKAQNGTSSNPRYWYLQGGAVVCLASIFFIRKLIEELENCHSADDTQNFEIVLYEGFLTFKNGRTGHAGDAHILLQCLLGNHQYSVETVSSSGKQSVVSIVDIVQKTTSSNAPAIIIPKK